jgi:CubicO group peptidase (beta-lactamase class C family)
MGKRTLMAGFPPSPEHQVDLANWRTPPYNRWAFQHVRELIPSANIPSNVAKPWTLSASVADMGGLRILSDGGNYSYTSFLSETDTDGLVILSGGRIAQEHYFHGMTARTPHILMSVSKSVLGIVAAILINEGELTTDTPVTDVIPELAGTAYEGATIRHLLDMRVAVEFDENYHAASGMIIDYRKSHSWNPIDPGEKPTDMRSFFKRLTKADGYHGDRFHYVSPNTDLLGWVLERSSGKRYADLVADLLWLPMGAAESAYITVDRFGAPRCAGGICATVLDLARLGQLMLQRGKREGQQIIPEGWIQSLVVDGDPAAWDRGDFIELFPNLSMHYMAKWYVIREPRTVLFGFGVFGQHLFVDFDCDVVIAKLSSHNEPLDAKKIKLTTDAGLAIGPYLHR